MNKILVLVTFTFISCFYHCAAYRILCPYPANSRSHFIVVDALLRGLAAKGHDVTVISAYPPEKPIQNYRHVAIKHVLDHEKIMHQFTKNPGEMQMSMDVIFTLLNITLTESHGMPKNPEVRKLMVEEQFDLMIIEFLGEVHIGLAAHFNCPVVIFSSFNYYPNRLLEIMGAPLALSYVGQMLLANEALIGFKERLINFMFYAMEKILLNYFISHYVEFHNEYFPAPKYPSYHEVINNNTAAIFISHHFSQGGVRPLVPGVIEVSGIQMSDVQSALPQSLQEWMDNSTNGVIYFSLGTILKVSDLTPDKLNAILSVCRKVKQNVLWKSDVGTIPDLPDNVRLEKWLPQLDVLNHKNMKLFITHGGLGSIAEAKYYGVPVLLIPMFGDQVVNADVVAANGWGIKLHYPDFTEEKLFELVHELLENPKYRDKAKYESMSYRDRPLTPLQTGIFWIEYILRHKGARHMRSNARELNWFQLHSLDVIGFLLVVMVIWAYVTMRILKWLLKKLCATWCSKPKLKKM